MWHAFELNLSAPREETGNYAERLAKKYGSSVKEAQARIDHLVNVARADGLAMDFEHIRPGNTFDAHRIVHYALEEGRQDAVKERFPRGYLCEGEAIGTSDVVLKLATEAGLDADRVSSILASDTYARDVRTDEAEAQLCARRLVDGAASHVADGRAGGVHEARGVMDFMARAVSAPSRCGAM